jgi:hypothetical protein
MAPTDPTRSFDRALARGPAAIVGDAGSADIGPGYLGSNRPYNDPAWEEHDLEHLVRGASDRSIPLIVGSCGVHGSDAGVEGYAAMVDRIARRHGLRLRVALLFAEQTREFAHAALERAGAVPGPGPVPALTREAIDASDRIVAAMGPEPILAALREGADVVLAGRSTDDGLFAAVPLLHGLPPAPALLAGKLLENASLVAEPFVIREAVLGDVDEDGVTIEPMLPEQRCTRTSVAAQIMYERRTPFEQAGPGGVLDLTDVRIEELDERRVRVSSARFRPLPPTVKLEGAGRVGYRAVSLAGCRDPRLIAQLDDVLAPVRARVESTGARVAFRVYGRDGVMREFEPTPVAGHEVGILIEAVAPSQNEANRACLLAKRGLFTAKYAGQKATAGSVTALPDEFWEAGPAYRWTVNHVVPVDDALAPFRLELRELGHLA